MKDTTARTIFIRRKAEKKLSKFTEKFTKTDFLQDPHKI